MPLETGELDEGDKMGLGTETGYSEDFFNRTNIPYLLLPSDIKYTQIINFLNQSEEIDRIEELEGHIIYHLKDGGNIKPIIIDGEKRILFTSDVSPLLKLKLERI